MAETRKLSRKEIAKMSYRDFLRASREPYRRLFAYMRPYRQRFAMGILFGALFGGVQALLIFDIQYVAGAVFPDHLPPKPFRLPEWFASLPAWCTHLAEWVHSLASVQVGNSLLTVLLICATVPLLMALRGLCSYLNSYCMLWVSVRVLDDIRQQVFRHTLGQSMEFFNQSKAGELVQTVFNQTRMAQQALTSISSDVVKQPITIVTGLAALFIVDWRFTLTSFIIFPLCLLPVVFVSRKVRKAGSREEEEASMLMVVMQEAFAGIRVVKTHAREDYEGKRFNQANWEIMRHMMRWRKAIELNGPAVETIASLGVGIALIWAWHFHLPSKTFFALVAGLSVLYPAFKAISRIQLTMQKCLASTTKVFELLDRPAAIQDAPDAYALPAAKGEIRFQEVTFSYGRDRMAVRGIDLRIPRGTTCALVGISGAGKSTLLALLQRLYEVSSGAIYIDGHDIRAVTQASLRENIATVSQDTFLFHDTIANNIRYGRLEATQAEVEAAAKLAFAHDFILEKPDGYQTVIGDKGSLLSGGQQQRISIARSLLKNAPILLLDEATSALDTESEKQIQAALETLASGRTVISIAHRLSTILKADQIVVLEHGEVKETGTHRQLYEQSGYYRRLYDLQFTRHEGEEVPLEEMAGVL